LLDWVFFCSFSPCTKGESSSLVSPVNIVPKTSPVKTPVGGDGDDAYCNGWRDGYIKEWNAKSNEFVTPKVPPCEENASLEGYKNGYKAGMKRAQLDKK